MKFHGLARDLFVAALMMVPFVSAMKAEPVSEEAIEVPEQPAVPTANVVLDGKVLFPVRGASTYPAEQRARVIMERIVSFTKETASERRLPPFPPFSPDVTAPAGPQTSGHGSCIG